MGRPGPVFDHSSIKSFAEIVVNDKRCRLGTDDVTGPQIKEKAGLPLAYYPYRRRLEKYKSAYSLPSRNSGLGRVFYRRAKLFAYIAGY
jgi:hypothetical protein